MPHITAGCRRSWVALKPAMLPQMGRHVMDHAYVDSKSGQYSTCSVVISSLISI